MKNKNKNSRASFFYKIFIFIQILYTISILQVSAQGDLMIFPKRLVFDSRTKVQDINLANTGNDTTEYEISFIQYRMTSLGEFIKITEPDSGQYFASLNIRYFPRRVLLGPNESQLVKVQVLKYDELKTGEYRSHLFFIQSNNNTPLGDKKEKKREDSNSVSVMLKAKIGLSIPCFIIKGESNTIDSISNLKLENTGDSTYNLNLILHRKGNMSTYGDISVTYFDFKNKAYDVGLVQGLAVYTPLQYRKCKMQLQKPKNIDFKNGRFKVVFYSNNDKKKTVYAEGELKIN